MQGVSGSNPLTSTTKRDCHRSPSSRGLGHDPFTVGTGVRIPVGTPSLRSSRTVAFMLSAGWNGMDDETIFCTDGIIFEKLNPAFLSKVFENFHPELCRNLDDRFRQIHLSHLNELSILFRKFLPIAFRSSINSTQLDRTQLLKIFRRTVTG